MADISKITVGGVTYDVKDETARAAGGGMTAEVKTALLNAIAHVAWADENGQDYYKSLYEALYENVVFVTGISLSKNSESIYTGYDTTVTATVTPPNATDKSIVWTSSAESVAKIEGSGETVTIKGVSDGSAVITATTADGGYMDTFTVTVATAKVTGIALSSSTGDITVGKTFELTATVTPAEAANKTVRWTTSNDAVATVTASADTLTATVTAVGEGTATITATTDENGKTATFTANVSEAELVEVIPTVMVRGAQDEFYYSYVFDDYNSIDTTDTSKIKGLGNWRMLSFDCSGASKIRIKRYIANLTYTDSRYFYACNRAPEINDKYLADPATSETTDVRYKFEATFKSTGYSNPKPVAGDVVTVGDFELAEGYKYLMTEKIYGNNDKSSPTDAASMRNEAGYYYTDGPNDCFKIFIVE